MRGGDLRRAREDRGKLVIGESRRFDATEVFDKRDEGEQNEQRLRET